MTEIINTYMQAVLEMQRQIGQKTFFMLGAKNLGGSQTSNGEAVLSFKVGRNAKGVTHVRITLAHDDTYRMEFLAIRGTSFRVVADQAGVYCDMLHSMLETYTGMRTSL